MNSRTRSLRIVALLENHSLHIDGHVRLQVEALVADGHQMTVISPHNRGEPWYSVVNGIKVYRFPMMGRGPKIISYVSEFFFATVFITLLTLWIWARHGLDVVHVYNPPDSLFIAALLPKLAGKTVVFHMRELSAELYASKYRHINKILYKILLWLERCACWLADHTIVVNESCQRVVSKRNKLPGDRVSVVRMSRLNKVSLTDPVPELRARAQTLIAFMGDIAAQDGVDHLLRALHHLDQDFGHKDWFCMLVGHAHELKTLQDLTDELGIADRIQFTGYLPEASWVPILSTADICVEPGPANPLNLVASMVKLLDYMALAKPIVAYDLPEHHVTAGEAMLYAKRDDAIDLARQLARLIEDPSLRQELGIKAQRRLSEPHLTWDYQRARLLSLYENLA